MAAKEAPKKATESTSGKTRIRRDPRQVFRDKGRITTALVVNGEPGYEYTFISLDEASQPAEFDGARQRLSDRGFEPCAGPWYDGAVRSEYVPTRPDVEIWRRSSADRRVEWIARIANAVRNEGYRHIQVTRPHLPREIIKGMKDYDAKPRRITMEELQDLVWTTLDR